MKRQGNVVEIRERKKIPYLQSRACLIYVSGRRSTCLSKASQRLFGPGLVICVKAFFGLLCDSRFLVITRITWDG